MRLTGIRSSLQAEAQAKSENACMLVFHANSGGLGNRLRALAGYRTLAQFWNVPFALCWEPTPACDAHFQDLFIPADITLMTRAELYKSRNDVSFRVFSAPAWFTDIFQTEGPGYSEEVFLRTSVLHLRALKPIRKIQERLDRFAATRELGRDLGLHVRLTDHVGSYEA